MLKVNKNIKNLKRIRKSKVSIKRIRMLKDQNNNNYLWCITYGYQGLWGVRLGSVRLGRSLSTFWSFDVVIFWCCDLFDFRCCDLLMLWSFWLSTFWSFDVVIFWCCDLFDFRRSDQPKKLSMFWPFNVLIFDVPTPSQIRVYKRVLYLVFTQKKFSPSFVYTHTHTVKM